MNAGRRSFLDVRILNPVAIVSEGGAAGVKGVTKERPGDIARRCKKAIRAQAVVHGRLQVGGAYRGGGKKRWIR